jgi:dipeptidyl aminopeptidase/acylaminoacyl peptidase
MVIEVLPTRMRHCIWTVFFLSVVAVATDPSVASDHADFGDHADFRSARLDRDRDLGELHNAASRAYELASRAEATGGMLSLSTDGRVTAWESNNSIFVMRIDRLASRKHDNLRSIPNANAPAVSPDGRAVAFWSTRSGSRQLWTLDVRTGALNQTTEAPGGWRSPSAGWDLWEPSALQGIAWSPDSRRLAIASASAQAATEEVPYPRPWLHKTSELPAVRIYSDLDRFPDPLYELFDQGSSEFFDLRGERTNLVVIDVRSRTVTPITSGPNSYLAPSWAPSGQTIAAIQRNATSALTYEAVPLLVQIALDTHTVRPFAQGLTPAGPARFSPNGLHLAFVARAGINDLYRLYALNLQTEIVQILPPDLDIGAEGFDWQSDRMIRVAARDGVGSRIFSVSPLGYVQDDVFQASTINSLRRAGRVAYMAARDCPASPLQIVKVTGAHESVLFSHETGIPESDRPEYVPLEWRNSSGEKITAMLLLPRSRGERRPPIILDSYPTTAYFRYQHRTYAPMSYVLPLGYAVLNVNSRAPHAPGAGRHSGSTAHSRSAIGSEGLAVMQSDIDGALDAVRRSGLADTTRVCGYGFSNGATTLAYYLLERSTLRCAALLSPVMLDFASTYVETPGAAIISSWLSGASPRSDPSIYETMSVFPHLATVTTPVLLGVGGSEGPLSMDAAKYFLGLVQEGKTADLLVYPKNDHGLGDDPDALTDFFARVLAYFDFHLRLEQADSVSSTRAH